MRTAITYPVSLGHWLHYHIFFFFSVPLLSRFVFFLYARASVSGYLRFPSDGELLELLNSERCCRGAAAAEARPRLFKTH